MSGMGEMKEYSTEDNLQFRIDDQMDELFNEPDSSPNHMEGDDHTNKHSTVNTESEHLYDLDNCGRETEEYQEERIELDVDGADHDNQEEEYGSDGDGNFELDDDNGNVAVKESASQPLQGERQDGIPTEEELEKWKTNKLQWLKGKIADGDSKIKVLDDKLVVKQQAIAIKEAEYDRQHAARNMGEHELQKIKNAKDTIQSQANKIEDRLKKAQADLDKFKKQVSKLAAAPLDEYKKENKNSKRKRKTRNTAQSQNDPSYNVHEGDDSLSEREGPEGRASSKKKRKNAAFACRRCKANKQRCDMKRGQCTGCAMLSKRCRYNDPWVPGRQLRAYQLVETEEKLAQAEKQISLYRQFSLMSVLADNPLSGITGYGPRPATEARQNYARLNRGLEPIVRPSPTPDTVSSGTQNETRSTAPCGPMENENLQQGEQSTSVNPAPSQPQAATQWIHQTVPPTSPAKRGRKPGQRSTKPKANRTLPEKQNKQQQQNQPPLFMDISGSDSRIDDIASTNIQHAITLPHTDVVAVNAMQCWWASKISQSGRHLPVNKDYRPDWPAWTLHSNEKRIIWFNWMKDKNCNIPLTNGGDDVLQPQWPSWTMVEEPMTELKKTYLVNMFNNGHGQELKEIQNADGAGQGKVDWDFYWSKG